MAQLTLKCYRMDCCPADTIFNQWSNLEQTWKNESIL